LGKFLRLHRLQMAAATLVVVSLVGGIAFAMHEARIAQEERVIAQRHFNSVRSLANKLLFDIHDEIARVPKSTAARELLVKTSLEYLDGLSNATTDVALQTELAQAWKKVGDIQGADLEANTGDAQGAMKSYERSIELLERVVAEQPDNAAASTLLADNQVRLARIYVLNRKTDLGLPLALEAVGVAEKLHASAPEDFEVVATLADAYSAQGEILGVLGRTPESLAPLEKMVALLEDYVRRHPDHRRALLGLEAGYSNAAMVSVANLTPEQSAARSIALLLKGADIARKLVALQPDDENYQQRLAQNQYNLGVQKFDLRDWPGAIQYMRAAQPTLARQAEDPKNAHGRLLLATVNQAFGRALAKAGHATEARDLLTRNLRELELLAKNGRTLRTDYATAMTQLGLGDAQVQLARSAAQWQAARATLTAGIAMARHVGEAYALDRSDLRSLREAEANLVLAGVSPKP
jgi:eukaryotic-like serine/threonine-protein kinase